MNRNVTRGLATSLPACVAYRLPPAKPYINSTLSRTLNDVMSELRQAQHPNVTVSVLHAQRSGGVEPIMELITIERQLPHFFKQSRFSYLPVTPLEFRRRAACEGKETILVSGDEVQLYRKEAPLATLSAGEISIDTLLFFLLENPTTMPRRNS